MESERDFLQLIDDYVDYIKVLRADGMITDNEYRGLTEKKLNLIKECLVMK